MIIFLIICICVCVCFLIFSFKEEKTYYQLRKKNNLLNEKNTVLDQELKRKSNILEYSKEKLKDELEEQKRQYKEQLEMLTKEHPLSEYKKNVEYLQEQIKDYQSKLDVIQKQQQQEIEKENFVKTHSIDLTLTEQEDIKTIKQFIPKLTNKQIMLKLIWSTYYQQKLQQLRKIQNADEICGIYKITNISSQKAYIGQAVSVGKRYVQHVKAGLGLEVINFNKFYSALSKEGIENFTFEILEECAPNELNTKEKYWINFYKTDVYGYNTKK